MLAATQHSLVHHLVPAACLRTQAARLSFTCVCTVHASMCKLSRRVQAGGRSVLGRASGWQVAQQRLPLAAAMRVALCPKQCRHQAWPEKAQYSTHSTLQAHECATFHRARLDDWEAHDVQSQALCTSLGPCLVTLSRAQERMVQACSRGARTLGWGKGADHAPGAQTRQACTPLAGSPRGNSGSTFHGIWSNRLAPGYSVQSPTQGVPAMPVPLVVEPPDAPPPVPVPVEVPPPPAAPPPLVPPPGGAGAPVVGGGGGGGGGGGAGAAPAAAPAPAAANEVPLSTCT